MNLMAAITTYFRRPRQPHQPHPAFWAGAAVVLALIGGASALMRDLDEEPKVAFGTRLLGYLGTLIAPDTAASGPGGQPQSSIPPKR